MELSFSLGNIHDVAKTLLDSAKDRKVLAFHGQMGAGKTTFISALCKAAGVTDTVGSPTFSIINEYNTNTGKIVYHIDLYRLKSNEEATAAGIEDCLYSGNLCLVEWPEIAPGIFPPKTLHVHISAVNEEIRKIAW
jgi:tRNA threonylcarbamoyladenosine biosynthesis protein TsaE